MQGELAPLGRLRGCFQRHTNPSRHGCAVTHPQTPRAARVTTGAPILFDILGALAPSRLWRVPRALRGIYKGGHFSRFFIHLYFADNLLNPQRLAGVGEALFVGVLGEGLAIAPFKGSLLLKEADAGHIGNLLCNTG